MTNTAAPGTHRIGVNAATNAYHAVRYAAEIGCPLNHTVTINWHRIGVSNEDALNLFRELRARVRRHWKHRRQAHGVDIGDLPDFGSHENPEGRRNTHWVVAVPASHVAEFERTVADRLRKLTGLADLGQALHFRPAYAVGTFAKYVLKGTDPAYAGYFRMRCEDQGFVAGRGRTFVARRLSHSARKAAGWKRTRRPRTGHRL